MRRKPIHGFDLEAMELLIKISKEQHERELAIRNTPYQDDVRFIVSKCWYNRDTINTTSDKPSIIGFTTDNTPICPTVELLGRNMSTARRPRKPIRINMFNTIDEAITEIERQFNNAMHFLRGSCDDNLLDELLQKPFEEIANRTIYDMNGNIIFESIHHFGSQEWKWIYMQRDTCVYRLFTINV